VKLAMQSLLKAAVVLSGLLFTTPGHSAGDLTGRVLGGGAPIADSSVTLWRASAGSPQQLGQTRTGADGGFTLSAAATAEADSILYLVARGGEPTAGKAKGDTA
jgi:hypothetical protein